MITTLTEFDGDWLGLRRALGLTQEQMASFLFVSHVTYWRWETQGRKPHPGHVELLRTLLRDPVMQARLKKAGYPHPWPEDVR